MVMRPFGQVSTQIPQPLHASLTYARPSRNTIASLGQEMAHVPRPRHPEVQTRLPPYTLFLVLQSVKPVVGNRSATDGGILPQRIMAFCALSRTEPEGWTESRGICRKVLPRSFAAGVRIPYNAETKKRDSTAAEILNPVNNAITRNGIIEMPPGSTMRRRLNA